MALVVAAAGTGAAAARADVKRLSVTVNGATCPN
jgi:hypothetical protein